MVDHGDLAPRQQWGGGGDPDRSSTWGPHCTPFTLPSNGVLSLPDTNITLTTNVVFQPECTGAGSQSLSSIAGVDPFYASTIPQTYVIAAATVIAWILVTMLIITPRTGFIGNSAAAPGFASGRGLIGGATGGTTGLTGVGSRPWLQKIAALAVAVSLTIATADTFKVARYQYNHGYMDARKLRDLVLGSKEIRITKVISDVFLWLAQVQTLIRLFPRHKEKVLIKWIGFALIVLDTLFGCLNSFLVDGAHPSDHLVDAIPALSYLFDLAMGLLYAAWVIYYSLTKRKYAFYHTKMKNICIIAALSLVAVLTPVVFFVTDVSNEDVAGWGDYFRWVGAAAASVVVWEWVERIEALERDEKKDGILGREVFDGDEMLDVIPSADVVWSSSRHGKNRFRRFDEKSDGAGGDGAGHHSSALEKGLSSVTARFKHQPRKLRNHFPMGRAHSHTTRSQTPMEVGQGVKYSQRYGAPSSGTPAANSARQGQSVLGQPTPPPAVASPVSRTDTTSAASTVYAVHYHQATNGPNTTVQPFDGNGTALETNVGRQSLVAEHLPQTDPHSRNGRDDGDDSDDEGDAGENQDRNRTFNHWFPVTNPFKRKRSGLPQELQAAAVTNPESDANERKDDDGGGDGEGDDDDKVARPAPSVVPGGIKGRLGFFVGRTGAKQNDAALREGQQTSSEGPSVMVIPAPNRRGGPAWSPSEPAVAEEAVSTTANSNEERGSSSGSKNAPSASTTLTANSNTNTSSLVPEVRMPHSRDFSRPLNASTTPATHDSSRSALSHRSSPPRADDISPAGDGTTIIPAPSRRANRQGSPLAVYSTAPPRHT